MAEFLTVAEVAELLKLNQQTVRNWIDRGELPALRAGARRVRVRRSDLDRFLDSGSTVPNEEASRSARFAVVVYTAKQPERIFGPFATEEDAAQWCNDQAIDVDPSPRAARAAGRRHAFILPFAPGSKSS